MSEQKRQTVILICDRGFIHVGKITKSLDYPFALHVSPCRTIRRWGSEQGLAQLVNGPNENTVLDAPCSKTVFYRWVGEIIEVDEAAWEPHLKEEVK